MALLNRLLQLLEFLEWLTDGVDALVDTLVDALRVPAVATFTVWVLSYYALLVNCDRFSSGILASAIALTLHYGLNRPTS